MNAKAAAFVCKLAFDFDELLPSFAWSLEESGGEILPHAFMANYVYVVLESDPNENWLHEFLWLLERHLQQQDDPVSNVIAVSFVEFLVGRPSGTEFAEKHFGPKLLAQKRLIRGEG